MPSLKDWLVNDSDTPPPFPLDADDVTVDRQQMRSLLSSQVAPAAPQELTSGQIARSVQSSGNSPRQIYQLIKQGVPLMRVANATGMNPETVRGIYQREEAVRLQRQGLSFAEIGPKLGVSEAEARMTFARGHVQHFGASPAVQYGRKPGQPFPAGVFQQPTYLSETNRDSASINRVLDSLRQQLGPQGFQVETTFEADALGGRHVVRVKKDNEYIGQPFRLTATPSGVPLISKTGKSAGGYRLTHQGQGISLPERLGSAVLQMAANHQAQKSSRPSDEYAPPSWDEPEPSGYDDPGVMDMFGNEEGYVPELPAHLREQLGESVPTGPVGSARGKLNVLDLLGVSEKQNKPMWRQINAGDYLRMSRAGQFREENSEGIVKNKNTQWDYPENLPAFYGPAQDPYLQMNERRHLTPVVSKGTVYPLEARNFIAGNIEFDDGRQWGSQKTMGKQMKRDELSLTRKYWQAGPALGVAYPEAPQHILGQRATEPEMAHIAKAFILDKGGIIPEGQMWKDTSYAPWIFGSFEQDPEKYELRFDPNYSEEEVLRAAGLLGPDGKFKPRLLKQGRGKVAAPNGFSKDVLRNNEAGVINGYEIVDSLNERGDPIKALRLKGYFGNRPNVVSAMKLEGWKNLAQDKNIRKDMGLDYDLIMAKPSDSVVANISMLNALPRQEFEGLWREVHGDRPAPTRTGSMGDVEALAKVWQLYQERNRRTEILPGRVFDADTLENYKKAGIIKDGKYEEVPPLFEGAETMYKADLVASGYMAPVRARFITDVTKLGRGNLSNEILRSVEQNFGGLGEHLRDLGYEGRDIYNTLYEMHQLNTKPGFSEHGSPVVDLIGDLTGNKDVIAATQALYQQKLAEIMPASLQGMAEQDYNEEQFKAFRKLQSEAGSQAIRSYYNDALGTDSYIFKMGLNKEAAYMANPDLVERFGYIDEETNEKLSDLKNEADYQLKRIWEAVQENNPGRLKGLTNWLLKKKMPGVIANQAELLRSAGARKRWFGTSDRSIRTHVHASDYSLPRNAMAMNWDDIFQITGLKRTRANRAYLNKLSKAGNLPFSGIRNPASDPIAQTGTILNLLTPDLLKAAGLDIPLTGHPVIFHPHHVQSQGGDNDSDQSQVYMVMKRVLSGVEGKMAGELVNTFGLKPSDPGEITGRAQRHAAGEYTDAVDKLNVTPEKARRNLLGFDPSKGDIVLDGTSPTDAEWMGGTLTDYRLNSRQIGQAYNVPVRVALNLTQNPEAKKRVSEYGGWMYQNPLDKKNYEPHSPEEDLFSFFTSFNAFTGSFAASRGEDEKSGLYFSYRKNRGFESYGQFGAAGLLSILKRLTEKRQGTQAQMTEAQMAAMIASTGGDLDLTESFIGNWKLPRYEQLDSVAINSLSLSDPQKKALQKFTTGDSPLAQMMRGNAVRNAIKSSARMQRKLQGDLLDPAKREAAESPKFKADLKEYMNVMQNVMYNRGQGVGSDEFKQDYLAMLAKLGLDPKSNNFFDLLEPGSGKKDPGEFYRWPEEKQSLFYKMAGKLFQKHVTGYGFDARGNWRNLDPGVPRQNAMFSDWYEDYDRIRDTMAVNARERQEGEDVEVEGYVPTLDELAESHVTGRLVREKHTRKKKALGGLSRLFEQYQQESGLNGSSQANEDFEAYVAGRKPWTKEEQEMLRQAELGHEEARQLRRRRLTQGYEEPMYFAEGGVLDRATRLGKTQNGRDIVAGEAGREYVVPDDKTQDLGGGVKVFDTDSLGKGAPEGSKPVVLAKGGVLDYEAYANAPQNDFETAIRQVAYELSGGRFTGDVEAARGLVRQQIEADIQRLAANAPRNGLPGLMASSMSGRATEMMAQALGPNPQTRDFSAWNDLLGEYGLSADVQPLGVNPQQIEPGIKRQLQAQAGGDPQAYKTALAGYMQQLNSQLVGKSFSHANYGNVYNTIPGWTDYWNGNRPASTVPAITLSDAAQGNLARLVGGAGGGGNGQPPERPAGEQGSGGAGEQRGKEITTYAQPFSPQQVEMYKTLAEKLAAYADTIEELNQNGATLAEVSGETAQVIKAAGKTYHRLEGQYSRAQRVLRYDTLQAKFDEFQYREGEALTDEESRELTQLQEQMVKPTGADVAAAGKVKGYIQDIFPVYAEREAAGRRGTRLPKQMIANSPLAWAAQIAGRDPGLVKEARQAERQALRLGQIDARLGDIKAWYNAGNAGRLDAFSSNMQPFDDAAQISFLSSQRQQAYEAAVPLKKKYDEAMKRGDLGGAQRLWDQIAPLNTEIGELKDQIGALTPHVKEHVESLTQQTSAIREELKERKQTYSALAAKDKELQGERVGLIGAERTKKDSDIAAVRGEMSKVHTEIKDQAKTLGRLSYEKQTLTDLIHEPQGRSITGMGSRPQTYGQQAWNELKQGYSPQKLFWEFQNIQQMQYMAFMPMLQMRQQYLGEQASLGQANYALGAGSMPQSVLEAMASQANMSRASSAFGQGVDNSITMGLWKGLTGYLGRNEGAGAALGSIGFDATSALTGLMGLKMVGGPALSALSKLAGGLGTGTAPLSLGTMSAAALGGGGLIAGGLGLGLGVGVYDAIKGEGSAEPSEFATVGAYGLGKYMPESASEMVLGGGMVGKWWRGEGNQERGEAWGQAVGKYTGAVTEPIPVWVTKMESEVAKQLGVGADQLPFDRAELGQMVQMAAEDQGLTKQQIESGAGIAEKLAAEIAESYTSGVSMSQRSGLRQRAIDISGYAPGTEGARMMSEWVNQGSLFERQQRLQAGAMVQNLADEMDFTPEQRRDMSEKVYGLLADGVSQAQVARSMQQRAMSNQYTWSAAAYASGNDHLALMDKDQPWLPKNLTAQWAVEDRRRGEDNARELGAMTLGANGFEWQGGRQEVELGWQRQKLDLEEEFWTFRRKSQLDDFAMQQKLFDFNIRQQRMALDWEAKQSRTQSDYYEKQYALNKKIFDLQTSWQRHDFDKQEARLEVRRDWQLEDSAWNRESFQIQSGWQMEDLQRALRYASSGRERMDIRRQMERASIMNERKQTEFDREDGRNTTQYNWAVEDLQDSRQRFEEMNDLQRQQMELGREYWQEQQSMASEYREARRAAMEEQIALQQEQNALNTQQFLDGMALNDKQHALETQIAETKQQWALDDLALARERAAEDEKMLGLQREMMSASYFYSFYQAMGYDAAKKAKPEIEGMATAAGKLADYMERAAQAATDMAGIPLNAPNSSEAMFPGGSAPSTGGGNFSIYGPQMSGGGQSLAPGGYMNGPMTPAPGFAGGGYTGDGDPTEVAGLVHRGEYVVPSGGALVVRGQEGNAEMVNLLSEMVAFQAAILSQLQEGGGTILIDAERLKKAGFLHQSNFSQVYG